MPDEPVDLPRGQTLIAHVERENGRDTAAAGSALDWLFEHAVDDPSVPQDLSYQHDHYLYGTPRKP